MWETFFTVGGFLLSFGALFFPADATKNELRVRVILGLLATAFLFSIGKSGIRRYEVYRVAEEIEGRLPARSGWTYDQLMGQLFHSDQALVIEALRRGVADGRIHQEVRDLRTRDGSMQAVRFFRPAVRGHVGDP